MSEAKLHQMLLYPQGFNYRAVIGMPLGCRVGGGGNNITEVVVSVCHRLVIAASALGFLHDKLHQQTGRPLPQFPLRCEALFATVQNAWSAQNAGQGMWQSSRH